MGGKKLNKEQRRELAKQRAGERTLAEAATFSEAGSTEFSSDDLPSIEEPLAPTEPTPDPDEERATKLLSLVVGSLPTTNGSVAAHQPTSSLPVEVRNTPAVPSTAPNNPEEGPRTTLEWYKLFLGRPQSTVETWKRSELIKTLKQFFKNVDGTPEEPFLRLAAGWQAQVVKRLLVRDEEFDNLSDEELRFTLLRALDVYLCLHQAQKNYRELEKKLRSLKPHTDQEENTRLKKVLQEKEVSLAEAQMALRARSKKLLDVEEELQQTISTLRQRSIRKKRRIKRLNNQIEALRQRITEIETAHHKALGNVQDAKHVLETQLKEKTEEMKEDALLVTRLTEALKQAKGLS